MESLELVRFGPEPGLEALLRTHPGIRKLEPFDGPGIEFHQSGHCRRVVQGDLNCPLKGLVEMMDNNPLVCADEVSVPSPAGTLALIALGPIIRAGILAEAPPLLLSFEAGTEAVDGWLATENWFQGALISTEAVELGSVRALTAIAAVQAPSNPEDLDLLYDEAFGRSFFVHRDESGVWDLGLVRAKPHAVYRLAYSPDEPEGLLTVRVIADLEGKLGAAQLVHAMNVMAGFDESLGITAD